MSKYMGLLGLISEANDIQQTEGCSVEEAFALARQRAAESLREHELATAESNIIPFPRKHL